MAEIPANIQRRIRPQASGCWHYDGHTSSEKSYQVSVPGARPKRRITVGRFLYEQVHEVTVPKPFIVCRSCNDPLCVNPFPGHAVVATYGYVNQRRAEKGLLSHQGSKNPSAVLTEEQVRAIFQSRTPPSILADEYAVGGTTIDNIKTRRRWAATTADLPDPPPQIPYHRYIRRRKPR